jgi:hypothetical protein
MIYELDERHCAIVKFEGGLWYGVRPLQQSDLSGIHMDPPPLTCADRRVKHNNEWMAADLLMAPLSEVDKIRFDLSQERFDEINNTIRERLQSLRGFPHTASKPALNSADFLKAYEEYQATPRFEQPYFDYNLSEVQDTIRDGFDYIASLERDIAKAKENGGFIMDCGEKTPQADLERMLAQVKRQQEFVQPVIDMIGDAKDGWVIFENVQLSEEAIKFNEESYAFSDSEWFGHKPVWFTNNRSDDNAINLREFLNGCAYSQRAIDKKG